MNYNNIDILNVINAAIEAGKATLAIYSTNFEIESKKDESPITLADKESHRIISEYLIPTKIPLMSEEGINIPYPERIKWEYYWLIDPLDGTKEFIKRNDEYTINIALIQQQSPVIGVIYVPVLDILYWAIKGVGAYKLESTDKHWKHIKTKQELIQRCRKLPLEDSKNGFVVVASRSHMSTETEKYIRKLKQEHNKIELISRGSSLKLCMIAEHRADIYPRFAPTSEWDTAAGQAIIECSGGQVLQINEKDPIIYNKMDILNPWFIAKR